MLNNTVVWHQTSIYTKLSSNCPRFKLPRAKPWTIITHTSHDQFRQKTLRQTMIIWMCSLNKSSRFLTSSISTRLFSKRSYPKSKIKSANPLTDFINRVRQLEIVYQRKSHRKNKLMSSIRRIWSKHLSKPKREGFLIMRMYMKKSTCVSI